MEDEAMGAEAMMRDMVGMDMVDETVPEFSDERLTAAIVEHRALSVGDDMVKYAIGRLLLTNYDDGTIAHTLGRYLIDGAVSNAVTDFRTRRDDYE